MASYIVLLRGLLLKERGFQPQTGVIENPSIFMGQTTSNISPKQFLNSYFHWLHSSGIILLTFQTSSIYRRINHDANTADKKYS